MQKAETMTPDTPTTPDLLDPDMPVQELRLHMGELTAKEMLVARAAIRWANTRVSTPAPAPQREEPECDHFYYKATEVYDDMVRVYQPTCAKCGHVQQPASVPVEGDEQKIQTGDFVNIAPALSAGRDA